MAAATPAITPSTAASLVKIVGTSTEKPAAAEARKPQPCRRKPCSRPWRRAASTAVSTSAVTLSPETVAVVFCPPLS